VGEVWLGVACAQVCECLTFRWIVLAAILRQVDRADAVAESREEAAGTDRGKLAWVTDEDRFPAGVVDQAEERCEDARFRQR
jgi:hypothetical protein